MQNISSSAAFADSKPHYELLDGLRGIAALLVIWYHIFEGFATSPIDQRFNHGYLENNDEHKRLFQTQVNPFTSNGYPGSCFRCYYVLYTRL